MHIFFNLQTFSIIDNETSYGKINIFIKLLELGKTTNINLIAPI